MRTVKLFQDFQRIFGFCPHCETPFRLTELNLFYVARPPWTPWDDLGQEHERLNDAIGRFEEHRGRLREKARQAGREEKLRRLDSLTSFFRRHRIELSDLKLLFHPVDYVAFRGLSNLTCSAVEFIDREPSSAAHEKLQRSIERTIAAGNVSWQTLRIADDGEVSCR